MRTFCGLLALALVSVSLSGCGEKKPDPRDRPDFVDTSDPSKTSMYTVDDFKNKGRPPRRP